MLIKPFKEHQVGKHMHLNKTIADHNKLPWQVDMKIMYYELIKMLIDYERKNQPETFDSTKTVSIGNY